MRKGVVWLLAVVMAVTLFSMPFLLVHCDLLPERATAYYAEKAAREAREGDAAQAELMRILLGGAEGGSAE